METTMQTRSVYLSGELGNDPGQGAVLLLKFCVFCLNFVHLLEIKCTKPPVTKATTVCLYIVILWSSKANFYSLGPEVMDIHKKDWDFVVILKGKS